MTSDPARDGGGDRLPLAEVLIDQPVDQLGHPPLDLPRRVGDDALLEFLLDARAVQQIDDPPEPQRVLEVLVAARLHVDEHLLDGRHPQLEPARQVGRVDRELPLDLIEHRHVVVQQREALVGDRRVAVRERLADAERVRQLQPETAGLVERLGDVRLERLETARRPRRRLAALRAQRQARAHRKDLRRQPQQPLRRVAHESDDLLDVLGALEDVDLVDDDDDLLAPAADRLEEGPLGFGERTIGGRDEQHEVGPRHEIGRQPLVLADHGVGAGRVDDVDVAEQVGRSGDHLQAVLADLLGDRVAVLQHVNRRRRRRHAFLQDRLADERVDERALAGVELADDDQQEELVELADRRGQRRLVGGIRAETRQRVAQFSEELTAFRQLILKVWQTGRACIKLGRRKNHARGLDSYGRFERVAARA